MQQSVISHRTQPFSITRGVLYTLFFFSGCSALMYQVAWQRMLFTLFGVDLESVTVIVSVFMLGLGLGGFLGGYAADAMRSRLLTLYVGIELMIAAFGFFSPDLMSYMGGRLTNSTGVFTAANSFLILAVPTLLMGATFPILVTHVSRHIDPHIGRSVGGLYFVNTLGGALGAYLSGFVLLNSMGLVGVINRAAAMNLVVGLIAGWAFLRRS